MIERLQRVLSACGRGLTWAALGDEQRAIAALRRGLKDRPEGDALYRAFDLGEPAACQLRNGDIREGIKIGSAALDRVERLRSRRARIRLAPLRAAAWRSGSAARDLRARVDQAVAS